VTIPEGSRADVAESFGPFPERWWRVIEAIKRVAMAVGATPAQIALAWAAKIEGLTSVPIFGGKSVDQLEENMAASEISLSPSQYEAISEAGRYTRSDNPYSWD
jgi:aryl-alcohol dehydrogenase-like predicted oxidoreductase